MSAFGLHRHDEHSICTCGKHFNQWWEVQR